MGLRRAECHPLHPERERVEVLIKQPPPHAGVQIRRIRIRTRRRIRIRIRRSPSFLGGEVPRDPVLRGYTRVKERVRESRRASMRA